MSYAWSASDIARIASLRASDYLLMLQFFFDDSGTHERSPVVVWGGVLGTEQQFAVLEEKWRALLACPLPGKPPLKKFHLTHCRSHRDEFESYSEAESDRLQFLFRSIIIDTALVSVAFGTYVESWERNVTGKLRDALGSADSPSIGTCIKVAFDYGAANPDMKLALVFDKGRRLPIQENLLKAFEFSDPTLSARASDSYLAVEGSPGLQAADIVANSFYRYAVAWQYDNDSIPDAHFADLLRNRPFDQDGRQILDHFGVFNEQRIREMVVGMRNERPDLWSDV